MRVSTNLVFDTGTNNIRRNLGTLYNTQNQISTGRRVLTPADDPVAAAQALVTAQSKSINEQIIENQGTAKAQLGLLEGELESLGNVIQSIRERSIQLGSATLTAQERGFIAEELQSRFAELVGIANRQNGEGQYLFSGFQGANKPFSISSPPGAAPHSANSNPYVVYAGDEGERLLQVDSTRQMSISASGTDVFMRIKQGNGTFATSAGAANTGTGVIDRGAVNDVSKWNASLLQPQNFRIDFQEDLSTTPPVLKYNLVDASVPLPGNSLYTNVTPSTQPAPVAPATVSATPLGADWKVYTPGQAIQFNGLNAAVVAGGDLGIQVVMEGTPATGDSFAVKASGNQSIFDTVQNLAAAATQSTFTQTAGNTELANKLAAGIEDLDRALENVSRVRASIGSRLEELDSLGEAAADRGLQHDSRLAELQDLDYAKAISDLSRQQLQLEAAQRSFVQITGLSLFKLL